MAALAEEGEGEEKEVACGVGDTSILATSSTMLLEAMCTSALDELLLELDPRTGPEYEEEDKEEVVVVEAVV